MSCGLGIILDIRAEPDKSARAERRRAGLCCSCALELP